MDRIYLSVNGWQFVYPKSCLGRVMEHINEAIVGSAPGWCAIEVFVVEAEYRFLSPGDWERGAKCD